MADSTTNIEQIETAQAQKEVTANALFDACSVAMAYGRHAEECAGLTWGYYGVRYGGTVVPNGANVCSASTTTYMAVDAVTGAVSFASTTTNWNDLTNYRRCFLIVAGALAITSWQDHRFGPGGVIGASGASAPGVGGSSADAYNAATAFDAYGDSITNGTGASGSAQQYANIIASSRSWTKTNYSASGDGVAEQATPVFAKVVGDGQQSTLMIGTNDVRTYTTSVPKQEAFKLGHLALAAWLAIPNGKKASGQAGSFSGTWTNATVYGGALAKQSIVPASTATYTTYGTVAYVASLLQNGIVATYSVSIDGVAKGAFSTAPGASVTSANGTTYVPALLRFAGLSEGPHTVVVTVVTASASNPVYVLWVAGNQGARTKTGPNVWVGNIPRYSAAGYTTYGGSDAVVAAFNQAIRDNVRMLGADGLNVGLVDSAARLNPSTDLTGDGLHPDDSGHDAIAQAFLEAINQIQKPGTVEHFRKPETPLEALTGTSYTVDPMDLGKVKTFSNAAAIAVTLPQAGVSMPNGWFVEIQNTGAGAVTITPTTSTINGAATLVLTTGQSARIVSDGTNYRAMLGATASSGAVTVQPGEMISGYIGAVVDKTYKIVIKAAHGGTITETTTMSESGTSTATFKINTTALGGSANSVSGTEQSQARSSANVFVAGDDIQITTSSSAACVGMSFTIKYTRTLA